MKRTQCQDGTSKQPGRPKMPPLDERTADFVTAAFNLLNAMMQGEALNSRSMILRGASSVILNLLQTDQYPPDQEQMRQLARLNLQLTRFLDHVVLSGEPDDQSLSALQEVAKKEPAWPTLVRPGDEKFTASKLEKLSVGAQARVGSLPRNAKHPPSLATDRNRLALSLVRRIENRAEAILQVKRNGVVLKCTDQEARNHLRIVEPTVPEKEHTLFLKLLRKARDYPFSVENLTTWNRLLTEFILIIDPKLERFPELKQIKSSKGKEHLKTEKSRLRSLLEKFFHPALQNLLR
jgi:hypothetical protein